MEHRIDCSDNVCQDTDNFCKMIDEIYCSRFPLKTKYLSDKRLQKPWLSSGTLRSIKITANYFKLHKLRVISEETNKKI